VPSVHPARTTFYLRAHTNGAASTLANAGDTITLTITLTNGVAVTNVVVATAGERVTNLLERLRSAVTNSATLAATNGVRYDRLARSVPNMVDMGGLFARTPGPDGAGIWIDYVVAPTVTNWGLRTNYNFSAFLRDWPEDLRPHASVLFHVRPTTAVSRPSPRWTRRPSPTASVSISCPGRLCRRRAIPLPLPVYVGNSSRDFRARHQRRRKSPTARPRRPPTATIWPRRNGSSPHERLRPPHNGPAALHVAVDDHTAPARPRSRSPACAVVAAGGVSNFAVVFAPATAGVTQAARPSPATPRAQTNVLLAGTHGLYAFTVASARGAAEPPPGAYTNVHGAVLTNSVAAPAPANGTQYVCTGWAMAGHEPGAGGATNFVMTATNDAALVWLWTPTTGST
jgi:hypothetical protein